MGYLARENVAQVCHRITYTHHITLFPSVKPLALTVSGNFFTVTAAAVETVFFVPQR